MASDQQGAPPPRGAPPRGWEIPRSSQADDADSLAALIEQLLALVPEELRVRLSEALRALLEALRALIEALRALIDWCIARLEQRLPGGEVEVRDIPIL